MTIAAGEMGVTITGLTIAGGSSFQEGDGLLNLSTGVVNIQACVIESNYGTVGGGIANEGNLNLTDEPIFKERQPAVARAVEVFIITAR